MGDLTTKGGGGGGGGKYTNASYPPADGNGQGAAGVGFCAELDALNWGLVEEKRLEDALPFVGGTGACCGAEVCDAVVAYWGFVSDLV